MSKRYKVLREMPNTPVGSVIDEFVFSRSSVGTAIYEGWIEELPENTRWHPKKNEIAYYIDFPDSTVAFPFNIESGPWDAFDNDWNVWKSVETAEKVMNALELFFQWLHAGAQYAEYNKLEQALFAAKELVIKDDKGLDLGE